MYSDHRIEKRRWRTSSKTSIIFSSGGRFNYITNKYTIPGSHNRHYIENRHNVTSIIIEDDKDVEEYYISCDSKAISFEGQQKLSSLVIVGVSLACLDLRGMEIGQLTFDKCYGKLKAEHLEGCIIHAFSHERCWSFSEINFPVVGTLFQLFHSKTFKEQIVNIRQDCDGLDITNISGMIFSLKQGKHITHDYIASLLIDDMPSLKGLKIGKGFFYILSQCRYLHQLESFETSDLVVYDIITIARMTGLKHLSLVKCNIRHLDFITHMKGLEVLNLSDNYITDISILKGCLHLKEVWLNKNYICDIEPLSHVSGVSVVNTSDNYIIKDGGFRVRYEAERFDVDFHPFRKCLNYVAKKILSMKCPNIQYTYSYPGATMRLCHPGIKAFTRSMSKIKQDYNHDVYVDGMSYKDLFDRMWPFISNHKDSQLIIKILDEELMTGCNIARFYKTASILCTFCPEFPLPDISCNSINKKIMELLKKHTDDTHETKVCAVKSMIESLFE